MWILAGDPDLATRHHLRRHSHEMVTAGDAPVLDRWLADTHELPHIPRGSGFAVESTAICRLIIRVAPILAFLPRNSF